MTLAIPLVILSVFVVASFLLLLPSDVVAEVYILEQEYFDYFDSNGVYTVVGNVKNENSFAILPTITIPVHDGTQTFYNTITHVPIPAQGEVPFKVKFPEMQNDSPLLLDASVSFIKTKHPPVQLKVLYDYTLIKHDDGHLTGRIQNTGNETIWFPTVHAVVHGRNSPLDVVQNIEMIKSIEPGDIAEFSMYPDPSITDEILYYSCFAPVDTTVIPFTVEKNGGKFDFRYDSGAWFSAAKFDDTGTSLTMRAYNSYPLETYANFEFVPISGDEEFSVTFDGKPVKFIQSIDELGMVHVAFSVGPTSQFVLEISGFEEGLPEELPLVPQWVKTTAEWWSDDQIPDSEFLEDIRFLVEKQIIPLQEKVGKDAEHIPSWVKILSSWWYDDMVSDEDFVSAMAFLIDEGIIIL